jgi:hypothetical protein
MAVTGAVVEKVAVVAMEGQAHGYVQRATAGLEGAALTVVMVVMAAPSVSVARSARIYICCWAIS